jgi:hypothetical protein
VDTEACYRAVQGREARFQVPLALRLPFREPRDFEALLAFLALRALPGIEEVREGAWRRTVREGVISVRRGGPGHLLLELRFAASLVRFPTRPCQLSPGNDQDQIAVLLVQTPHITSPGSYEAAIHPPPG